MTGATSLFFYGTLRYLPLLTEVMGRAPETVPATLSGHATLHIAGESFPTIRPQAGAVAEGLLVHGVTAAERARLDFYEGAYHYVLSPVTVETAAGPVAAEVYFPTDRQPPAAGPWCLDVWAARHGPAATLAARELMVLAGRVDPEDTLWRYPQMMGRAHSALRARAGPAPATLRRPRLAEEVEVEAERRPYSSYFAVAEYDLRFPLFGGGHSRPVTRGAFLMGDAVTVLPYDPVRDRVMLIEQFRFGPYMRGDPLPWSLEPVAGRIDGGEAPEAAARREAAEETGITVGALHHVGSYYPSPGAVTEFLWSYVGIADLPDGVTGVGGKADEAEDILSHVLSFERLMELVNSGEAGNGPLILTAYWLARHREGLRSPS